MKKSVLFFGRKNCTYTKKIKKKLKSKTNNLTYIEIDPKKRNIDIKRLDKKYDFILCFRSHYILKKNLIDKAQIAAINFHPGPPQYRGIGSLNFAIFNNSKFYGSTVHLINQKIDNGKIIDVKYFPINKKITVKKCLYMTHLKMYQQAKKIIELIFTKKEYILKSLKKNKNIKWSNKLYTRKDLEKLYSINIKKSNEEISRQIRATYTSIYKPYIKILRERFILSKVKLKNEIK
jgi:methionyl-tRNA formyltransferase